MLEYTLTNDILFKIYFVKNQNFLKRFIALRLGIDLDNVEQFEVINPEIPPEMLSEKFCRLDVNMKVNGQRIDLEIQVADEGDYPERSLYYWARDFSSALPSGGDYVNLPRTILISILGFRLFKREAFHSEFQLLEVSDHTPLTDKQVLHFFELPKLPPPNSSEAEADLWLALFAAKSEEDLKKIEELGVPIMNEAITAYRSATVSPEFREAERLRSIARHNEAAALRHAAEEAAKEERQKWQLVVMEKEKALADKDAEIARLRAQFENK
jgi:predicted transposase/invertase (TIGR01784 family)